MHQKTLDHEISAPPNSTVLPRSYCNTNRKFGIKKLEYFCQNSENGTIPTFSDMSADIAGTYGYVLP